MTNILYTALLLLLSAYALRAQNCRAILDLAGDKLKNGQLPTALEKLQDAENCDVDNLLLKERQAVQKAIFKAMNDLRETAEKNFRELQEKTRQEKILQQQTRDAYRMAEQARDSLQQLVERLADANSNIVKLLLGEARRQRNMMDFAGAADKINTARLLGALPDSVDRAYAELTASIMGHCRTAILNSDYMKAGDIAGHLMEYNAPADSAIEVLTEVAFCLAICNKWQQSAQSLERLALRLRKQDAIDSVELLASRPDAQKLKSVCKMIDRLAPGRMADLRARYLPELSAHIPEGVLKGKMSNGITCDLSLKSFSMAPRELTFFEYDVYCTAMELPKITSGKWGRGAQPVIDITWYDAVEYCNWRSVKEDLTKAYVINKEGNPKIVWNQQASGYRLPLSSEWEFAAGNGARQTQYSWGNAAPSDRLVGNVTDLSAHALHPDWEIFPGYDDGFAATAPVGSFEPNDFGLYDMTGNVWEWCYDQFSDSVCHSEGSKKAKDRDMEDRMLKGGSWSSLPKDCLVDARFHAPSTHHNYSIGFRLTRN